MSASREGWYPDPSGDSSRLRYWDGEKWTDAYAKSPENPASGNAQAKSPSFDEQASEREQQQYETDYSSQPYVAPTPNPGYFQPHAPSQQDKTLRLVAFIFSIISLAIAGWFIVPLAWMIPMTVYTWRIYQGTRPNTIAFGVCMLIFVSTVAGILLLVSKKDE